MNYKDIRQLIKEIRLDKPLETMHLTNQVFYKYFYLIGKAITLLLIDGYEIKLLRGMGRFSIVTKQQIYRKKKNSEYLVRTSVNNIKTKEYGFLMFNITDDGTYNTVKWWKDSTMSKNTRLFTINTAAYCREAIKKASKEGIRYVGTRKVKK